MKKNTISNVFTYRASFSERHIEEHFTELNRKNTRLIEVGEGSLVSARHEAGLSRHSLPIMISADSSRNTYHRNLFFVDLFGYKAHEQDFLLTATLLSAIYEDPTIRENYSLVNRLAGSLYVRWIAGTYIRNFGLTHDEPDLVRIVVGLYYYYQGQVFDSKEVSSDEVLSVINRVSDNTGVPQKDIKNAIDKFKLLEDDVMMDFNWLMDKLRQVSMILEHRMNPMSALIAVSNSWYPGMTGAPQLALSYRPFFIAMLYHAFNDRSTARVGIQGIIKDTLEGRRRDQAETFVRAIEGILKTHVK